MFTSRPTLFSLLLVLIVALEHALVDGLRECPLPRHIQVIVAVRGLGLVDGLREDRVARFLRFCRVEYIAGNVGVSMSLSVQMGKPCHSDSGSVLSMRQS